MQAKCIRCGRCVVECAKVQHCSVWDFKGPSASYHRTRWQGKSVKQVAHYAVNALLITPQALLTARNDIAKILDAFSRPRYHDCDPVCSLPFVQHGAK